MSVETHFGKPEQPSEPNKTESKILTGFMKDGALSILKEIQWFKENNKIDNSIYNLFEPLQNSIRTFMENQDKESFIVMSDAFLESYEKFEEALDDPNKQWKYTHLQNIITLVETIEKKLENLCKLLEIDESYTREILRTGEDYRSAIVKPMSKLSNAQSKYES